MRVQLLLLILVMLGCKTTLGSRYCGQSDLLILVMLGCKTTAPEVSDSRERSLQRFEVLLHLESDEDLKRVVYDFSNLKMAEVRNVTDQPVQLIVSIECTDYEIDGFAEKIGMSEGCG